jgi:sulfite exporter TauE/SafE
MTNNALKIENLHLGFASVIVVIVGLSYGIYPNKLIPIFFDFKVESVDLKNVFRAIMGLYLGLVTFWIVGILKPEYWRNATLICTIFMGGLAFGRIISIIIDGIPSLAFSIGTLVEILFMVWGIKNLRKSIKSAI